MELEVETRLSQRPRLQPNGPTALTASQQRSLNMHKVVELQLLFSDRLRMKATGDVSVVMATTP